MAREEWITREDDNLFLCCSLKAPAATQSKIYCLSSFYCPLTSIDSECWEKAAGFILTAEVTSL